MAKAPILYTRTENVCGSFSVHMAGNVYWLPDVPDVREFVAAVAREQLRLREAGTDGASDVGV